ncbi:MAG: hypothetical protein VX151_04040 [Candidatus Thermoplasmatota archaeon]|nr:hypothetical protein [Candidatus Thermoplasmatota archaeon]
MEIWLRQHDRSSSLPVTGVDRLLSLSDATDQLHVENGVLYDGHAVLGAHVVVKDGETQNIGIAHMGTVDWILVECETWSMITL